jgi:dynein heavy chain
MMGFRDKICPKGQFLLFCDFLDKTATVKHYSQMESPEQLKTVCADYLHEYNSMSSSPMALVLFFAAIEHVAKIARILGQPYGNALLVGVGGSGRKSCTKLAAAIVDFECYSIEISKAYDKTAWREDLKQVMRLAGLKDPPQGTVFLFSDTEIVEESFVEDINGILNTGEVPNLFNVEEMTEILETMGPRAATAKRGGAPAEVYAYFMEVCRNNLHVVLAFSPIGDAFRTRLRMFPSLVNCCTIDWFSAWPEAALQEVANEKLSGFEIAPHVKNGVVACCVAMQKTVRKMSVDFLAKERRHYYVTPTSYLELIRTFTTLLSSKREEVSGQKARYDNGLQKLVETAEQVDGMKEELTALQPKLVVATQETNALIKLVKKQSAEADEKKAFVQGEETACNAQAEEAGALKASCEHDLADAIPAMESAIKALKTLSKGDIVEVKSMKKPPGGVKLTMEAVCIMMGVKPKMVPNPEGKKPAKIPDYWEPAQKELLNDTHFLQNLMDYDKDNIPLEVMAKVEPYAALDDFQPKVVQKGSVAAAGLCKWVHAMVIYDKVAKVVAPKKIALAGAQESLASATAMLNEKRAMLQELMDKLLDLNKQLSDAEAKKEALNNQVKECSQKLLRAEQLIGGLGGEQSRWAELSLELGLLYDNITGDIVLASGVIAYLGAFTASYREEAILQWKQLLLDEEIAASAQFSLASLLGEPVDIRSWTINKLPNDAFSIDNAIMLFKSNRWPLMIDPQGQANRWIKNMYPEDKLKVLKQNQPSFVRVIESSVQFGHPVLLENAPQAIDPVLDALLGKAILTVGGISTIKIGDNAVEYHNAFQLYITTKMRNPHYPPETCVKVNLLNFMATAEGLQDQMLGIVVAREQEKLEAKRQELVLEDADNKRQLKEIEDTILKLLKEAEGNILDDEILINTLADSKTTSVIINEKAEEAAVTMAKIKEVRESYTPIAFLSSNLFFCIADLGVVDPMYQYSLEWFIGLFVMSIAKAEPDPDFQKRLLNLAASFKIILYKNVCRSLFEKDKLLFSFLLCSKIMLGEKKIIQLEVQFFLQGDTAMDLEEPNPCSDNWLTDKAWGAVLALSTSGGPGFKHFSRYFEKKMSAFYDVYESPQPMAAIEEIAAKGGPIQEMTTFQKLCILRCLRLDCVVPAILHFIAEEMGQQFIEPPPFNLLEGYEDSTCTTPLIFVLTPGADPMSELLKLANQLGFAQNLTAISLGQGQGPLAEAAIQHAVDRGNWVCLQNCHLCVSWMPTLERLAEELSPERCVDTFRLWLTSEPSKAFPQYVLQNGVKMTNEPPKGMRANLMGSYHAIDEGWYEECLCPKQFKKLLYGLCFFHATVRERKKFGPLGWNMNYVFSGPDLFICRDQLRLYLDETFEVAKAHDPKATPDTVKVPYEALAYLAGECNYGGRVTDDKDRRCLVNILSDFYCELIMYDEYTFSDSGTYLPPPAAASSLDDVKEHIGKMPFTEGPEVFGLHENANISASIRESLELLSSGLLLQPRAAAAEGMSWEDTLMSLAKDIVGKVPEIYDTEKAEIDFPVEYEESMNTVITQELMRFNKLNIRICETLNETQRALKGLVVMSSDLEAMGTSMVTGRVPNLWASVAYPSLKPLGAWVTDFLARLMFLQDWLDSKRAPPCFWISGFFFTQAFITGTKQNFARKYSIPIELIDFNMKVLGETDHQSIVNKPQDGSYIHGLFLQGARWDSVSKALDESRPKELFVTVPIIHLLPTKVAELPGVEDTDPGGTAHVYRCPVYKESKRQGVLMTTGHSTNFVIMMRIPMQPEHKQKHWVKRGVAMLLQLDD